MAKQVEQETPLLLTKDAILAAEDAVFEDVHVPEWGGTVRVKALSGAERDRFEALITGAGSGKKRRGNWDNVRARLVALTIIDDKGKTIFSPRDVEALGNKSASALDRVFSVAQRLAGITDADVEELEENFN